MVPIDWNAVREEVTGYLRDLIRLDTTNPPGNEILAAEYLAGVLRREGLHPRVTESQPGRGNVTARLPGGGEPLVLLGHTDVVAVEPERWRHPPFDGQVHDGYVWGRGALDMKNMVAAELMVFLLLKRRRTDLKRDVIFAATADEEAGKGRPWRRVAAGQPPGTGGRALCADGRRRRGVPGGRCPVLYLPDRAEGDLQIPDGGPRGARPRFTGRTR